MSVMSDSNYSLITLITCEFFSETSGEYLYRRAMGQADFAARKNIANLLINRVKLYPDKAIVEGVVPVVPDVLSSAQHATPFPPKAEPM